MGLRSHSLVVCREVQGDADIIDAPPSVERLQDVLFIPLGRPGSAGVFDRDGRLVRATAYFRGRPHPHFPLEAESTDFPRAQAPFAPDGPRYVFGGHFTAHYGHFFFAMLARLWWLPRPVPADVKFVLLASRDIYAPFEPEFSRTILEALGLTPEHFVSFQTPVRFRELLAPWPAVEENHNGRPAFAELCHRLAGDILGDRRPSEDGRPIYLSKRLLRTGVHSITNEHRLCGALARRGVEVVFPERLPLSEQIGLWAGRRVVAGTFGSMLHTSIFTPQRRYVALNPEPWINSNQVILDRLNRNEGAILFPREGYHRDPPSPEFGIRLRLKDPEGAARDIAREIERAEAAPVKPAALSS